MREESHLDDMRSAIRGDFERLAERRGGQELMSVDDEPTEPDVAEPTPEAEPQLDGGATAEPEPEPAPDDPRSSWLDRLLGR